MTSTSGVQPGSLARSRFHSATFIFDYTVLIPSTKRRYQTSPRILYLFRKPTKHNKQIFEARACHGVSWEEQRTTLRTERGILRERQGHARTSFFQPCSFCISAELNAVLLFHSSSPFLLYSTAPLPQYTTLSVLSGCPHASLPGAVGALGVTWHHSALGCTVYAVCCVCMHVHVCVWVRERRLQWHKCARMCKLPRSIWVQEH